MRPTYFISRLNSEILYPTADSLDDHEQQRYGCSISIRLKPTALSSPTL